ncbi:MAG: flagellar basal body rod protein FlgB [Eubacteriales bacterium]|nr:flagellar basal body rod protein FlgB [Eubacteriales bacterium]MDD4390137.1 flagellar basal body rod protein FlgB [Eubacteriales bacterium]
MIGDSYALAILQRAMDGTWQKQRAIANNIANQETPGYKAVRVSFEESLQSEVAKIQESAASAREIKRGISDVLQAEIKVQKDYSTSERLDGNNVNADVENIEMARTQIQYQYLTRSMTDMFSRMRYAISEGKK